MNRKRCAILSMTATLVLLTASGDGMAQNSSGAAEVSAPNVQGAVPSQGAIGGSVGTMGWAGREGVRAAPYSADSVTESTQVLSDGNRITHKTVAKIYRDSEGRTRREQTTERVARSVAASGESIQFVTITDPVAGAYYVLDSRSKIAQRRLFPSPSARSQAAVPSSGSALQVPRGPGQLSSSNQRTMENQRTTESLGTQIIEGLEAEGTRTTMIIPAGTVGNERPIESVSEIWFSPALQTAVLSKHVDPRTGETVTRLTNIRFEEPDPALFQTPPEYTVRDQPAAAP